MKLLLMGVQLYLLSLVLGDSATKTVHRSDVVDRSSFIVQAASRRKLEEAKQQTALGQHAAALKLYFRSLALFEKNQDTISSLMAIGSELHQQANFEDAILIFERVIAADSENIDAYFRCGVSRMYMGDVHGSASMYNNVLMRQPGNIRARLNIASLHHRYGRIEHAIIQYEIGLEHLANQNGGGASEDTKLHQNLAVAYLQVGDFLKSNALLQSSLTSILNKIPQVCGHNELGNSSINNASLKNVCQFIVRNMQLDGSLFQNSTFGTSATLQQCKKYRTKLVFCLTHLVHLRKSSSSFDSIEIYLHFLRAITLVFINENGQSALETGLTPFDSLLDDVSMSDRLEIAQATSARIESQVRINLTRPRHYSFSQADSTTETTLRRNGSLKLGFLSYDFNDHPTAHLVEGIFEFIRNSKTPEPRKFELYTYSYGKDDNSSYRKKIVELSHHFRNIVGLSHAEAAKTISGDDIDILLEMQVHTLGNRLEIVAARPAPIQVNYLVYPGTSGAAFLDSIVADSIVLPPEHAKYYSENIVMVPPTYQVSFYERHLFLPQHEFSHSFDHPSKLALRKFYGLPVDPDAIIFCNFNKVDKIDQISLHTWLGVLQRLPSAFLWLLEPTKVTKEPSISDKDQQISLVKENLIAVATTFGIASGRIIFASRVEKSLHIARHAAADLFLDTFTYGAHSTATDALFGGIPVLTVQGGTFGSRVGASLYASICTESFFCNIVVSRDTKQFQDSAVRIGGSKRTISALRVHLSQAIRTGIGLFLYSRGVDNFLWAMQALKDARSLTGVKKNVITNL